MDPQALIASAGTFALIFVGGGLKHLCPWFPNRYIPLTTFLFMCVVCFWAYGWEFTLPNFLATLGASLAPTGAHGLIRSAAPDVHVTGLDGKKQSI